MTCFNPQKSLQQHLRDINTFPLYGNALDMPLIIMMINFDDDDNDDDDDDDDEDDHHHYAVVVAANIWSSVLREWILQVREVKSKMKIWFTHFEK